MCMCMRVTVCGWVHACVFVQVFLFNFFSFYFFTFNKIHLLTFCKASAGATRNKQFCNKPHSHERSMILTLTVDCVDGAGAAGCGCDTGGWLPVLSFSFSFDAHPDKRDKQDGGYSTCQRVNVWIAGSGTDTVATQFLTLLANAPKVFTIKLFLAAVW